MILEILLNCGGENEKYVLKPPTEASNTQKDAGQTSSGLMSETLYCPDNKIDETNKPVEIADNKPIISITDSTEQETNKPVKIADNKPIISITDSTEQETNKPVKIADNKPIISITDSTEQETNKPVKIADNKPIISITDSTEQETNKPVEIANNTPSVSIIDSTEPKTHLTDAIIDPENGGDADAIALFDKVLIERELSLQRLQAKYDSFKSIYDKKLTFTNNERKKFQICRNELAKLTGEWLAEDILAGFSQKKREQLVGKGRCKCIGLNTVRSNNNLKQTIINQVKTKGAWKRISKNMKNKAIPAKLLQLVNKELERIGVNHLKETEGPNNSVSNTFKKNKKKPNKPKKKGIAFVKGNTLDASDDSSGMEYSDELNTSEDET